MRVPGVLSSLRDQGIIDDILRPLKSGKEAEVYLVRAGGAVRVAKVYKDADQRSFKQRSEYMEGRRVRNTRDQRAMDRRSRHGKAQQEQAWKSVEVDTIYRLHAQGVRVPEPYNFIDGVLIMELVCDADGEPAPRLAEVALDPDGARRLFDQLLREVVKMLCAGIVHGDLSDYNVLVDAQGPVVIDFPQAVDASMNRNARKLLVRDVNNLSAFLARAIPGSRRRPYGEELWAAYENNRLTPDLELTGRFRRSGGATDMRALLESIEDAESDERMRRQARGEAGPPPRKREARAASPSREGGARRSGSNDGRAGPSDGRKGTKSPDPRSDKPTKRRRRRRKPKTGERSPDAARADAGTTARAPSKGGEGERRKESGDPKPKVTRRTEQGRQGEEVSSPGAPRRRRRRRRRKPGQTAPGE